MVSNELKQILKNGTVYAPDATVYITSNADEQVEFSGEDLLASIEVEQTALSPAGAPIGGLATGELKVVLRSFDEFIHELLDVDELKEIYFDLAFGEEIYTSDVYNIDKLEVSEDNLEITITSYDPVYKLNVDYVEPLEDYPALASDWVAAFAATHNINIDASELPFINETINQPNVDNMSAKQVFSKFLEWNFAIGAYENNILKCRLLDAATSMAADEEADRNSIMEYKSKPNNLGKHGVNTLTLALSEDVESENHSTNDADMVALEGKAIEIRLSGNPFFSTPEERVEYADRLFQYVRGFNYHAYELDTRMLYLKPTNIIEQTDLDSLRPGTYNIPIYTYKMVFDGGFKVSLAAPTMDSAETAYKWTQLSPSKRTEVKVDKLEGTIDLVAAQVEIIDGLAEENRTQISLNKEGILQEVLDRTAQGELIVEQTSSLVQQTVNSFDVIFNKIESDQGLTNGEIELIQSYFRINENGVIIGKSGSQIEFFAENNRVGFRENGNDIAYWEEGTMHVDQLIAVVTITIGYHLIEKYDSLVAGNTTIVRMGD